MFAQFLQAGSSFLALVDRGLDRLWPAQALSDDQDPAQIAAWRRPSRLLFLAVLLCGLPIAMNRAIEHKGASDFVAFYDSARYLMEHGTRSPQSEMARYLPSADVPWLALAILPVWLASMVYYLLGCWSWIGLLDTTGRHLLPDADETTRRRATFLTGLLVAPLAVDGLCLGTFHIFMVWLMVAGLAAQPVDRFGRAEGCWAWRCGSSCCRRWDWPISYGSGDGSPPRSLAFARWRSTWSFRLLATGPVPPGTNT